jgi:uncharacterized membrane-anchored protein YhcB (DUF1043 family)
MCCTVSNRIKKKKQKFQKVVKKFSKTCQKVVKKLSKSWQKVVIKLAKSCQIVSKKSETGRRRRRRFKL